MHGNGKRTAPGVGLLLLLALGVGLATGWVEVLHLARRAARHLFVWRGQQALWMTPLAEGALFVGAGLALSALGRVWERLRSLPVSVAVLGALGALSALTLYGRLHPLSNLLLAAGLGALAGRLARRRPLALRRAALWGSPALLALTLAVALGSTLWRGARERDRLASLPPAARDAPNVLLLVLDTVRAPSLSLYGHPRPTTPNLERLARRGVRFDRAIAPSSWTLPTHATLFTGRQPHELRVNWHRPLDGTYPTLAEHLGAHGYRTAGFVANRPYTSWESGLGRGFVHYEDYGLSLGEWIRCSSLARIAFEHHAASRLLGLHDRLGRRDAGQIRRRFLAWVDDPSTRPFFAFLNYYDAHFPYLPPEPFAGRFGVEDAGPFMRSLHWGNEWGRVGPEPSPSEVRRARDAYEAAIAYLDFEVGVLLRALDERGLLDDTIVIVTSDHGEEFAEHRVTDHGNSLYLPSLHVPLVIVDPRRPSGSVVEGPVGLRDLPATIVDLLDLEAGSPFPGRSLVAAGPRPASEGILSEVRRVPRVPDWFPVSRGDMRSLVLDSLHYILGGDGREEVFHLYRDPWETRDLARGAGEPWMAPLRGTLQRLLASEPRAGAVR